jgi:uncharacterized protein (TIGR02231 family)
MMVRFYLTVVMALWALPVFADPVIGTARVDRVTLYQGVAQVTRQVQLDLGAGRHDVIVPDLPAGLSADGLQLRSDQQVVIGAVNLAYDRLPVTPDAPDPAVIAATQLIAQLQDKLRQSDADIAQIRLAAQVATDQIGFLQSLGQASLSGATISDLQALAQMVGAQTLDLRSKALDAEQQAQAAIRAQQPDRDALADAERALAALLAPKDAGAVLRLVLDTAVAGPVTLEITSIEGFATWAPVYDLRLGTGDAPALVIDRAVVLSQNSGQDWRDVQVTLSTAQPLAQIAPSGVWPQLRRIVSPAEVTGLQANAAPLPSRMLAADAAMTALADTSGAVVRYTYPARIDIRDGVEDLRLALDQLRFDADIWAEAVPMADPVAYRMAGFTNAGAEILLPGAAVFYVDGAMVGQGFLPMLAAGAPLRLGFGPLDGLAVARVIPARSAGDAGVFTSDTALREQVQITLTNRTGQDWDVVLRDAVPYSEQDDLQIDVAARPAIDRRDIDGQRGIVEWDLRLPAGAAQVVSVDVTLRWPAGFVLR